MARPKSRQGRYENISVDIREDLLLWLDNQAESRREMIETALVALRRERRAKTLDDLRVGAWVQVSQTVEGRPGDIDQQYAGQLGVIVEQSTFDKSLVKFPHLPARWCDDIDLLEQ